MMTETPVPQLIIRLAVPTIISMLVTAFYNSADTYFVGKISNEATAAVGLVFSVMALIQALGFFCGHGSGNYLSRMLGAGKKKEASEMASTGFALALLLGVIVAVTGIIFMEPIASFLGATENSIADTKKYMAIILIGAPFMMCQFVINNQLRFQGSAMYAMVGLMIGAVINIGFDPLFIFGFKMGVAGAAIATVSGQLVSFIVLFIASTKGENLHLSIKNVRFNAYYMKEIINGGSPSLERQGLAAVATVLMNNMARNYGGDAAIAAMSIVTRIMMLVNAALIGFGQGFQPVCAFNYGAGLRSRVKEGFWFCVKYGTIFLTVMAALCIVKAPEIVAFFRDDEAVIAVAATALRFHAAAYPFGAMIVMTNMLLQSIGRGGKASILASARNGIFCIPTMLLLPRFLGLLGIQITQPIADVCSVIMAVPFALTELMTMNDEAAKQI